MPVVFTHDTLKLLKRNANGLTSGIGSSHLSEAIAAGVGYKTHLSLRAALNKGPTLVEISDAACTQRLKVLGGYHCETNLLTSALHDATLGRIREVADRFPRMTRNGLNPYIGSSGVYKTRAAWEESRAAFLSSEEAIEEFLKAELWLAHCKKGAKVYRGQSSYGMKHSVERWLKRNHPDIHYYVANGAFIAAAVANGFDVEQVGTGGLNCFINVASTPSEHPGITTLCDRRETFEVTDAPMLGRLSEVVKGWEANRTAKRSPETSYFVVKHGLKRIQRDSKGRVRVSGYDWSVLLTEERDLANSAHQQGTATLRGDLDRYLRWHGGKDMPSPSRMRTSRGRRAKGSESKFPTR